MQIPLAERNNWQMEARRLKIVAERGIASGG
jgi:hypothetical protein